MWRTRALPLLLLFIIPSSAAAQGTVGGIVTFLMTNQAVPTQDFERDRLAAEAARDTIARALLVNLTTVPIATSSGGFLYRLNPELGTVERATDSFGAFFVERALTAGRGRVSAGVSANTSGFDRLNGNSLRDGTLLTIANRLRDEPAPFDTESLTLRVRTSTMTFFTTVGVTDRLEVGAALPIVRLSLTGERINVYHGTSTVQANASAIASGVADIAVRGKYSLLSARGGGIAAEAEIRLPTGDEENLLGAGEASWRVMGIGSLDHGNFALHGNVGLVRGGISDEVTFGGAALVAMHPRLTLSGEVVGRQVAELRSIMLSSAPHPTYPGVDTLRLLSGTSGGTVLMGLAGAKWNLTSTVVIGGHVAWPLTDRGLTAPFTPTLAFEYAF
jgi:hypothetical protein